MISWDELNKMTLSELVQISNELFRRANYRIARLGDSRKESAAYRKVETFVGSSFLKQGKYFKFVQPTTNNDSQKKNQLVQGIFTAQSFMESQTSTKTGMQKVQANRRKWVRENFDGFESNKDADEFLRFLGSDEIRAQMQTFDSNIVVEALAVAGKNQPSKKLKEIYDDFKKSGKSWGGFIIDQEESWQKRNGIRF